MTTQKDKNSKNEDLVSYRWCVNCKSRYADKGSDYCKVCEKSMLGDEVYIEETKPGPVLYDASEYTYGWDSGREDESKSSRAPKNNAQEGKPKMHLLPLDLLREFLVPAYEEGLIKYFEESWRLGFKMSDMMDGLQRHMESFYYQGEDLDQETLETYGIKKTHLGAALFCVLCMCNTLKNYPELDDRVGNKDYKELADKVRKSKEEK